MGGDHETSGELVVMDRHFCTYFDRGFLIQGLTLWRSLQQHDPKAILWVLALDDYTARILKLLGDARLRVVLVDQLEEADEALARAKGNRTRVEYYFTLSPCWPRWLLETHLEIEQITYLDADLFLLGSLEAIWNEMDTREASVLLTAHRFGAELKRFEKHGIYNVGILSFRRDEVGLSCLDDWRERCIAWCHDRLEDGKYADQKYLEAWPARWGEAVWVCDHAGLNAAPWNWTNHRVRVEASGVRATFDDQAVLLFHFARLRPILGTWWWQSGQIEYGVMPWAIRQAVYGPYGLAMNAAREELRGVDPAIDFNRGALRLNRRWWQELPMRLVFGGDWLRCGTTWVSGRAGLGRYAGRFLAFLRKIILRK